MSLEKDKIDQLAAQYDKADPTEILALALEKYDNIAISFSGAEDVVLVDMAARLLGKKVNVFSLDTGRLHSQTYRFLDQVKQRYNINFELLFPESKAVEALVNEKGFFSFRMDGHKECCQVRKVAPLRRKLSTLDAWVTGQRKDQSPDTRSDVPVIQEDMAFSTPRHTLVKFNPLANWTSQQVWNYIQEHNVPYNELHRHGFISIGCEPCTRPILPNEHERNGRWWWEETAGKECGLHPVKAA
ncbi:phosphoadenylyl-sulfate reductase [Candidatus Albibeggiatoa sp. nov. NOAA]|uniref:phosphoadenylyl-sulfate reductase n=1 Tax=Candidatus Albibeggiatoa sp. nov. NOAA TaxID=3162724 RepID=UPI003304CF9D|nr:phosphoadenylyl-sulfate reductase [Thiotrichaceae bacterium]